MHSYAIILNGTSSSGKTSIARALQRTSKTPILHASLDTFTDMFFWSAIPKPEEQAECHKIGVANFHAILPILASSRFPVVVDHVFERHEWYEACRDALKEKSFYLIGVRCPLEILEKRERDRGDRRIGLARMQFERAHASKPYDLEVDTSVQTSEECAKAILGFIEKKEGA